MFGDLRGRMGVLYLDLGDVGLGHGEGGDLEGERGERGEIYF